MIRRRILQILGGLPFIRMRRAPAQRYAVPPMFWYENLSGDRYIPTRAEVLTGPHDAPEGFIYQWSQFPCALHNSCCTTEGVMGWTSTWDEDLVLALVRDGYRLRDSILIVATMCERCNNAAAYDHGLKYGYPRGSAQWHKANTVCEHCVKQYSEPDANGIIRNLRPVDA